MTRHPIRSGPGFPLLAALSLLTGCLQGNPVGPTVRDVPTVSVSQDRSGMAPDDAGDPYSHHDYTVSTGGETSTFVWVPRFVAYQLRDPAVSGYPRHPIGAWVKAPAGGQEGRDWVRETFGGFYAGKFEASQVAGKPVVQAGRSPWGDLTWSEADRVSREMIPGKSHLLRGDEWTSLAVWAMVHEVEVHGNTEFGQDSFDPTVRFQKTDGGAALTGSGQSSIGLSSPTSHTGGPDGVMDLVGNLREWDGSLTMQDHEYLVNGQSTGVGGTMPGFVATLLLDPVLRRQGITGSTTSTPSRFFSGDAYHTSGYSAPGAAAHGTPASPETLLFTNRGGSYDRGHFDDPAQAGLWLLCVNRDARYHAPQQGFRPALSY